MPDVTPAQELRAAAERLRDLAAKATPGPWTAELRPVDWDGVEECWVTGPLGKNGRIEVARGYAHEADDKHGPWLVQEDAAWIATFSPAIAEPLAAWLNLAADDTRAMQADGDPEAGTYYAEALALARAILAAPPPSPTSNPGGET